MRRELLYLGDAIEHTKRAISYSTGCTSESLEDDPMRLDAILRNLQIVGEAVKQIPSDLRTERPEIPWAKIAGVRNRLVHHYFGIDTDVVVDICQNHLEPLLTALLRISEKVQGGGEGL